MQRAIDSNEGSKFDQSKEYRNERAKYSQHKGDNVVKYTNFALDITNQGSISNEINTYKAPRVTQTNSVFNNTSTVSANNIEFDGLDKKKGDNLPYNEAVIERDKAPNLLAIYKDVSEPGGYGVATKDIAAQKAQNMVGVSEEDKQNFTNKRLTNIGTNTLNYLEAASILYGVGAMPLVVKEFTKRASKKIIKKVLKEENEIKNMFSKKKIYKNNTFIKGTPQKVISNLKNRVKTKEIIEIPDPSRGLRNKIIKDKIFAKENRLSSPGRDVDKLQKIIKNTQNIIGE